MYWCLVRRDRYFFWRPIHPFCKEVLGVKPDWKPSWAAAHVGVFWNVKVCENGGRGLLVILGNVENWRLSSLSDWSWKTCNPSQLSSGWEMIDFWFVISTVKTLPVIFIYWPSLQVFVHMFMLVRKPPYTMKMKLCLVFIYLWGGKLIKT